MSYYDRPKNYESETYSPVDFKKSTAKVGYYSSSTKDPEIEDLKERYGVKSYRNKDKYSDSYNNFGEIRKVPEEISNLRATFNAGSKQTKSPNFDRFDKEDNLLGDGLRKNSYRVEK